MPCIENAGAPGEVDERSLRATAALLWAACRPQPDVAGMAEARAQGASLDRAVSVALMQWVSPLLRRAFGSAGSVGLSAALSAALNFDAMRWRVRATHLLPRAVELSLVPLGAEGLEPVVVKGAALAGRYPDASLRPMEDVDLLLPVDQHPEALAVMLSQGWREAPRTRRRWREVPRIGGHFDEVLEHPDVPGLPVSLHHDLETWRQRSHRLCLLDLWERRRPQTICGVPAQGLDPADEVVFLATHAAKPFHVFSRLLWAVDIAVVIGAADRACHPIDWHRVANVATGARGRTALAVALSQARRLGAASPDCLCRPAASGTRKSALYPVMSPDWPVRDCGKGTRRRLRHALIDSRRHRIAVAIGDLMTKWPL